jgi:hypothetical protein
VEVSRQTFRQREALRRYLQREWVSDMLAVCGAIVAFGLIVGALAIRRGAGL